LNQLRDELQKVQQALGAGRDKAGPDPKAVEAALDRTEQLRQMLQAAQQGQAQGRQQGGRQPGGQQQSGQTRNGAGGQQTGGQTRNGAGGAMWNSGGVLDGQEYGQFYRDTLQGLDRLQGQLKDDPDTQRDIRNAVRDLRPLDPARIGNDPLLAERIQAALANLEQVELELRRMLDASGSPATVRSPGNQPVPEGYLDAVAEYYRRLSRAGKQ
jgi:hypothetical protein